MDSYSSCQTGRLRRHPHHDDQVNSTTLWPRRSESLNVLPLRSVTSKSGAIADSSPGATDFGHRAEAPHVAVAHVLLADHVREVRVAEPHPAVGVGDPLFTLVHRQWNAQLAQARALRLHLPAGGVGELVDSHPQGLRGVGPLGDLVRLAVCEDDHDCSARADSPGQESASPSVTPEQHLTVVLAGDVGQHAAQPVTMMSFPAMSTERAARICAIAPIGAAGSESEQVGDEFSDLSQRDGPDVRASRLDDAVNADGRRQVRLGDTEPSDVYLAQPSSSRGRAGYDHDRVLPELEHVIGGDDDRRPDEPWLAPRRRPEIAMG